MPRPARVSPERILTAAAEEFSARGYGGAGVDRIARRARVNKAMIYYHFGSKQKLYRALLRHTFAGVAARLQTVAASGGSAADQLDRVIATFAGVIAERPTFPAIMLREVAEGGAHLDRETLAALAAVPLAVAGIVQRGIRAGELRPIHPLAAHFTLVAPVLMFLSFAPVRTKLAAGHLNTLPSLSSDDFVRQLQDAIRRALTLPSPNEK